MQNPELKIMRVEIKLVKDFLLFMIFSTFEGMAIYSLALYTFRMDFMRYLWHSIVIIEFINLQNFFTREEIANASVLAPILNLLITMLFFVAIARVPLIWSMLMTITGFLFYVLLQTILLFSIFQGVQAVQENPINGYIIQFLTGAIGTLVGRFLYKKGYGFTFDFDKISLRKEKYLIISMIIVFILSLGAMMFYQNLYVNFIGFLASLLVFLYYSIRREDAHGI